MAKVGDTVSISAKVISVHPQGFPSGVEVHGEGAEAVTRPKNPLEKESPDTLEVEFAVVGETNGVLRTFIPDPAGSPKR